MKALSSLAICVLISASAASRTDGPESRIHRIELGADDAVLPDPILGAEGRFEIISHTTREAGALYVYALSDTIDLVLRIVNDDGDTVAQDDNSGGGTTPYATIAIEPGTRLRLVVAGKTRNQGGVVTVHTVESADSPETLAAAEKAGRILEEINALLSAGRTGPARERVREAIDELLRVPGVATNVTLVEAIWPLACLAQDLRDDGTSLRVLRVVRDLVEKTYPPDHRALTQARWRLSTALIRLGKFDEAKTLTPQVVELFSRHLPADHRALLNARSDLARVYRGLGDLENARTQQEAVLDAFARTRPDDDTDLAFARWNLAGTLASLGRLDQARALYEAALETLSSFHPENHPQLQLLRTDYAVVLRDQGEVDEARALQERVLDIMTGALPDDDLNLQRVRGNLAQTLIHLGELEAARDLLVKVHDVVSRTLPDEHQDLQTARISLAQVLLQMGDPRTARALQEKVLDVYSRTLPDDHPAVLAARGNLGATLHALGEWDSARRLRQSALEGFLRIFPEDHPDVQTARSNLAWSFQALGDYVSARALLADVLDAYTRTRDDESRDLLAAQGDLANILIALGDASSARIILERQLSVESRRLPHDHLDVQITRVRLASLLSGIGEPAAARKLVEAAVEVLARRFPAGHEQLRGAQLLLAWTLISLQEFPKARTILEEMIEQASREELPRHPQMIVARSYLADVLRMSGDLAAARRLGAANLDEMLMWLPDDHPSVTGRRITLARTLIRMGEYSEAIGHLRAAARSTVRNLASCTVLGRREMEERALDAEPVIHNLLSMTSTAVGRSSRTVDAHMQTDVFALVETARSLGARRIPRSSEGDSVSEELRRQIAEASAAIARIAHTPRDQDKLFEFVRKRDASEAALRAHLATSDVNRRDPEASAAVIAEALGKREVAVGYWRYSYLDLGPDKTGTGPEVIRYMAFVLRNDATLVRVELGPAAPIEAEIEAWRDSIGAPLTVSSAESSRRKATAERDAAVRLRRLVWDPIVAAIGDARFVTLAAAGALHLVPIDGLPLGEGSVGDRYRIVVRSSLAPIPSDDAVLAPMSLLALGGGDYDNPGPASVSPPQGPDVASVAAEPTPDAGTTSTVLRGSVDRRSFAPLPGAAEEARSVARLFRTSWPDAPEPILLTGSRASRDNTQRHASRTRFLHLATHGFFAPPSSFATETARPIDAHLRIGRLASFDEQVRAISPRVLCGLAFAGANVRSSGYGHAAGIATAEELASLDLSGCELCVLSACDTNVGLERGGQGIASLRQAIHAAGARSVITSLWRVPDDATSELMTGFYRRLWVEKKPKHQALWEAKRALRDKRYPTRSWAGWVLTGAPD